MSWDMASWAVEKERQQDMLRHRPATGWLEVEHEPSYLPVARMVGAVRRFSCRRNQDAARVLLSADQETCVGGQVLQASAARSGGTTRLARGGD